jgi:Spy/CpxP family protein refolding chaperone
MDRENTFNWKVRMATLGIFLLGAIAGALALNAYQIWFGNGSNTTRQQRFERVLDQVQLSDTQRAEFQKIMSETREEYKNRPPNPEMEAIRQRADEKIKKVLTSEQWENFQRLRTEFKETEKNKNENKK